MKYILLALPFLAAPALAQQDDDPYKTLSLGDRVQVTFRSGGTISGQLVVNPIGRAIRPAPIKPGEEPAEKIDYTKESSLTIDVSWEYPGLNGTMTIVKKEIKEVKKLQHLDKETLKRLMEQKAEVAKDLDRQNRANQADSERRTKAGLTERAKIDEQAKKADDEAINQAKEAAKLKKLEILKLFPPDQGWGPDKFKDIGAKALRKQPLTDQENLFMQSFGAWAEAKSIQDEMQKTSEKKETPPEEKKP